MTMYRGDFYIAALRIRPYFSRLWRAFTQQAFRVVPPIKMPSSHYEGIFPSLWLES